MNVFVAEKDIKGVNQTGIIQQTAFWSEVKMQQGFECRAFDFKTWSTDLFGDRGGNYFVVADLLVLIQQIDDTHSIAYVPYGPEIEPIPQNQGSFLEELSESLRPFLPAGCIVIRYDLTWESHWAREENCFDQKGNWTGPPEKKYQELRLNFNTQNWNLRKANTDILPSNTIFLNLKKDQKTLLAHMKPKTRYNINLSFRKGVTVRKTGMENLDVWYKLYAETARRNSIYLNDIHYFRTLLTARANDSNSPAEVELLLAEAEGIPLAAMFLVTAGNRTTYLYGASSSTNRNYMAPYALQWAAITGAREKGCTEYDFFGVAPRPDQSHPMYGLYKFKTGFGGNLYHRLGCWDYPLNEKRYNHFKTWELQKQGYYN